MAIKREASYIGLAENANIRYDVIDREPLSQDFFEIKEFPTTLTAGKNVFKFRGDPDTLVDDSKVHIEILDYNGDPIYFEVLNYLEKDGVRTISIWIYPDTPVGKCTFYLAGRALYDPETNDQFPFSRDVMSDNWVDLPNVLWTRTSRVAPNRRNNSEILFLQEPEITIEEQVKTFSEITDLPTFFKVISGSASENGLSISGTGPAGGYSTVTTNITTPTIESIAAAVTKTIWPQAQNPSNTIPEASFSSKTPSKSQGIAKIAIAMPSTLAKSPAVSGTPNNSTVAQVKSTTNLTPAKVAIATVNVGNNGPGGTTSITMAPSIRDAQSSVSTPQNNVTTVSTIVYNPPDTTVATFAGLSLSGSQHLGATVIINNPQITAETDHWINGSGQVVHATSTNSGNTAGSNSNRSTDATYIGTIVDIENSTTCRLHPAFDFLAGRNSEEFGHHVVDFGASAFTMSYWVPQMSQDTENSMSFANIRLANIEPSTGDVYSVKTLYKLMGAPGDYTDVGNTILEMKEVLSDTASNSADLQMGVIDKPMGALNSQEDIDTYWEVAYGSQTWNNDYLGESVLLESTDVFTSQNQNSSHVKWSLSDTYKPTLYANTEYNLSFFTKAEQTSSMEAQGASPMGARVDVYMSGSKIHDTKEYFGAIIGAPYTEQGAAHQLTNSEYGNYLGSVEFNTGGQAVWSQVQFVPFYTDRYKPIFVVRKGKAYIKNIQLNANIETGFSPNHTEMNIRIPTDAMNAPLAFKFQFLDYQGAPAECEPFAQGAIFDGDNTYISGEGNLITGSVFVGNTVGSGVELAGVNSAYMRSIGYTGFTSASAGSGSGFMFWSGSVLEGVTDDYDNGGVGLELVQDSASYFRFRTNPAELDIRTQKFFLGSDSSFISGSGDGTIAITSSNFHLDTSGDVIMQGTITAEAGGTIGGWGIGTNTLSSSNNTVILDSSGNSGYHISASGFQVDTAGAMTASAGKIANWEIVGDKLQRLNASDKGIILNADPSTQNIEIREDDNNRVQIYHTDGTNWGIKGTEGGNNIFRFGDTNKIASWNFTDKRLYSFTTATTDKFGISIDADYQLITIHGDSGDGKNNIGDNDRDNVMLAIGQTNTSNEWGIKGWSTAGDRIFELSTERQEIAGWSFDDTKLQGGNMILRKDGTVESDGFVSNLAGSGFRLTAVSGGMLEVENARIRGTLSTAVFEKETVNAVGGQLYVANSSVLTGSALHPGAHHAATDTTMSIQNVSGFAYGEILSLKKISSTGFTTEYVKVQSASRFDASSDTDYGGYLFVTRSLNYDGSPTHGPSGSLGDSPFAAQSYTGSQVIVSTGKIGTGYIRLNANPNDPYTPYMQIVERTGSGLYDLNLQAQIGDLSGITDSSFSDGVTGFGLYTGNGYFKGKIEVSSLPKNPPNDNLVLHLNFANSTGSTVLNQANYSVGGEDITGAWTISNPAGSHGSGSNAITQYSLKLESGNNTYVTHDNTWYHDGSSTINIESGSWSSWFKCDDVSYNSPQVIYEQGGDSSGVALWVSASNVYFRTYLAGANAADEDCLMSASIDSGEWYHVVGTLNRPTNTTPTASLYLNSVLKQKSHTMTDNTTLAHGGLSAIGALTDDGNLSIIQGNSHTFDTAGTYFTGSIDEIRVYAGKTLTDEEVQGLYLTPAGTAPGSTIIEGGRIQTGNIQSTNWGTTAGSNLRLDDGVAIFGGSTNQRIELNGTEASMSFFNSSGEKCITLDDDLISTHPGMLMTDGTLRIVETSDFGNSADAAPLYVEANDCDLGSNRVAGYFGIGNGASNANTAWGTGGITGMDKCGAGVASRPYMAAVFAEANMDVCPGTPQITAAYVADVSDDDSYAFYGVQGKVFTDGEIQSNADVVAFFSSDKRQKDNILIIDDPINKIKQLRGVSFDWNEKGPGWTRGWVGQPKGQKHDIGVIAQEVQTVLPEAVTERSGSGYLAVNYEKIVPLLIEGIKEQQDTIEELETRIKKLENK